LTCHVPIDEVPGLQIVFTTNGGERSHATSICSIGKGFLSR